MRSRWANAAIIVLTLAALGAQAAVVNRAGFLMGDFRAFYCASRVAAQGANPYHVEPLRTCETSIGPKRFFERNPGVTIPAPLPGYAIAAFMPLALLPFVPAAVIWLAILLCAWAACIASITKFAGLSWQIAVAALAYSLGVNSVPFGEVVPVALAGIAIGAYCAWRGHWIGAAAAAAVAMIEPHLALPACIGLAIWAPATRVPLGIALAALAILSAVAIGVPANIEYLTSVLPAHAMSELTRDTQYSLTALLAATGVPELLALKVGTLWYVVMLVIGVTVGGLLARKTNNAAFLVCTPPAFAVFGGTFIHVTQIVAAIPCAILAIAYAKGVQRTLAVVALLVLCVPWVWTVALLAIGEPHLRWIALTWIVMPIFPMGYLTWFATDGNRRAALWAGVGAAALLVAFAYSYTLKTTIGYHVPLPAIAADLPEASWSVYSRGGSSGTVASWLVRTITWTGQIALLGTLIGFSGLLEFGKGRGFHYQPREAP